MQSNGSLHTLTERIRAKTERDAQEIENLTRQQFADLSRSLAASSKNALSTTESAILNSMSSIEKEITSRCRIISVAFGKMCLQVFLLLFCALLAISLCGWGVLLLFRGEAQDLRQEIVALKTGKAALEQTVAILENKTWGITLYQDQTGRFIIPRPPLTLRDNWKVGKNPAWKVE
jgi:hypothetical protein